MKSRRIRIQAAALAFILMPAAIGVVAVNASATCERFVRTYVTKPVRNSVSKTTAEAWVKWRLAHPNWKPNPNLHRPKYVMNREEAVQKVDFACTVPLIDMTSTTLFAEDVPPIVNFPHMQATEIQLADVVPPEVAELTPQNEWPPIAQYVPPILGGPPTGGVPVFPNVPPDSPPPVGGPVSEPASLLLVGTGLGCICLLLAVRIRTTEATF